MEITEFTPASFTGFTPIKKLGIGQTEQTTLSSDLISNAGKTFEDVIQSLNTSQAKTDNLMTSLAAGEDVDIHDAMIAMQENDINFRIAMAVRDKLVDAYREVTRIAI